MPDTLLGGLRILITQADDFMGPTLCEVLAEHGADVIASRESLIDPTAPAAVVTAAGRVDVLIANLAVPAPSTEAVSITDDEWRSTFAALVDPLPRLVRAVLPSMIERKSGRILVMGSATALRGMRRTATYGAARAAQIGYVLSAALEAAQHNVQINAIAQNFVENPTYYPVEVQARPRFQEFMKREVPLGRLVSAREDAEFAAYLCSKAAACFVGQVFPVAGGWAIR
ncbi:2-keto-3-deoxy-L-fuconate dehydrogenase [Variovorax sp. GrIS 2.14]|uniref:SDR family oxidoreductase n=1 Tax=Variovorax sp. GrIS 2.14 TaxID=3071709 RepID=UPI0038F73E63